MAICLVKSYPV